MLEEIKHKPKPVDLINKTFCVKNSPKKWNSQSIEINKL